MMITEDMSMSAKCVDITNGPGINERWIRLPSKGRCPITGFSRATFYDLINAGKIKTSNIRRPGCVTGIRLVWLPSVLEYIEKHVEHVA